MPAKKAEPKKEVASLTPQGNGQAGGRLGEARGQMPMPAVGRISGQYGEPTPAGISRRGIDIATRPGAQVVAPYDGKVVFAGPFRAYGQLLIISVGEGYHVLLAGMTRINGLAGQSILAGEPVGIMGSSSDEDSPARQNGAADNGGLGAKEVSSGQHPALYIEFRKDGDPIDPRPWLMMSDKKARG